GTLVRGLPVELVIEDGADRSVAEAADVDRARGGSFEPIATECAQEAQDAAAGAEALLGMGAALQDEFAQRRSRRPDALRLLADAIDGPVGIAPVTGRHMLGDGRVLVVAARSYMSGDPLAPGEDLHGTCGEAHLDFGAREAVGHAVEVMIDVDVIVDADAAQ